MMERYTESHCNVRNKMIETMIVNVDRKTRSINLSIKAKDQVEQSQAMQKLASDSSSASSGTTNLGALLKAKMDTRSSGQ